jgi:hypothetical protein
MAELRLLLGSQVSPELFDALSQRGRFGWARFELKNLDLLGGPDGTWALTDLGARYVEAHKDDLVTIPPIALAPRDQPKAPGTSTKTVPVTGFRAYAVPLLEALAAGHTKTKDIVDTVGTAIGDKLLPGDKGSMPGGSIVWRFRTNWGLSFLGKEGDAVNVQPGVWHITEAGHLRLQRERPSWDLAQFPPASATIVIDADGALASPKVVAPSAAATPARTATLEERWALLRETLPVELVEALAHRLRPDLGPTPSIGSFARNVILYGPPGTGKTHMAKLVAKALTGDDEIGRAHV